jgi:hypothetical protein
MMKLFLLAALVAVAAAVSIESNDPAPVLDAKPLKIEPSLLQTKTLLAKEPDNCLLYCRNVMSNLLTQWTESFNVTK